MVLSTLVRRGSRFHRPAAANRRIPLRVEQLEDRCVPSVYTPAQVRHAFGFDQIMFGSINGDGAGQTIAIVDAYDAPKIASDLDFFSQSFSINGGSQTLYQQYGASTSYLTKATPPGQSTPVYNSGWSQEITLDVQWAHAIAPGAHLLLVEAASNSFSHLFGAVDYARNYTDPAGIIPPVSVVSMSWGSGEFPSESSYDYHMTTPPGHVGVSFIASSGDSGAVVSYPAVSPNVLGVGGTSVQISSAGTWLSESGWSGSGGGISAYESKPSYQSSVTQSSSKRTSPDVAYDADPNTGVYVYWTPKTSTTGAWYSFGGTSAGAPQWAALVAIANQGRTYNSDAALQGSLDGPTQLLPAIYNLPAGDFHDVTSGKAGRGKSANSAGTGYDLMTGRGSPLAQLVVQHLVTATSTGAVTAASSAPGTGGQGGAPTDPVFVIGILESLADSREHGGDGRLGSIFAASTSPGRASRFVFVHLQTPLALPGAEPVRTAPPRSTSPPAWLSVAAASSGFASEATPAAGFVDDDPAPEWDWLGTSLTPASRQAPSVAVVSPAPRVDSPPSVLAGTPVPVHESTRAAETVPSTPVATEPKAAGVFTNVVAKTFSTALCLAGAVAFFTPSAVSGRSRRLPLDRQENERERSNG